MLELDHIFVCVADENNAVRTLTKFGLNLSPRRIHSGQGTANRVAFFDNAYLELLLQNNDEDLQSQVVQTVSLWERMQWKYTGASPFGVAFRFIADVEPHIPIPTRPYDAPFLPPGISMPIATPQDYIREPLIFFSLVAEAPINLDRIKPSSLEHKGSHHQLTKVEITTLAADLSPQLQWFCDRQLLSIDRGQEHHAELEWDYAKSGHRFDFRPILPFSIRW